MKITEENQEKLSVLEKIANGIIWWVGSIQSLVFHTIFFIISFALPIFNIVEFEHMLLVLTTVVSLEAIYLAIFIQMSVNKSTEHIEDLKEDVNEIQEDIDEIQEDIEEIQEDVEEIQEDIDEIQEDVEEINEDDDDDEDHSERARTVMLKTKVSNNKNDIKNLKDKIKELEGLIENLKKEG
ncbi:Chromosome partition protein Smc [compost metagenome]